MDEINTMGIMKEKKLLRILGGVVGLSGTVNLAFYQYQCLRVIFLTPCSGGNGDYYDTYSGDETEVSMISILLWLIPIFLQFYPWLKLFTSMIVNHACKDYYGQFVGDGKMAKIISVLLVILNVGTIIWFTWVLSVESNRISNWRYEYALCPDNSVTYVGYILFIIAFWGIAHIVHYVILNNDNSVTKLFLKNV